MDPNERTLRARLGAQTSWANTTDPSSRTAKARAAANGKFEKQARELHPNASDEQIARVAAHLKSAHYTRMALTAARNRRLKSAAKSAA